MPETNEKQWVEIVIAETRKRLFEEGIPRLKKCMDMLSEEDIWIRPNEQSNSVGNLVLHLCGNVRQWLISGLGGAQDVRERDLEFSERGPLPKGQLVALLDQLEKDVEEVLNRIHAGELLKVRPVQIYQESGLSILIHVIEHFSYHVGQVTYFTKSHTAKDTGYYADQNL